MHATATEKKYMGFLGSAVRESLSPLHITNTYATNTTPKPPVQVHADELNQETEAQEVK